MSGLGGVFVRSGRGVEASLNVLVGMVGVRGLWEVLCAGCVAGVDFVGGSVVTYSTMWLSLSVLGE